MRAGCSAASLCIDSANVQDSKDPQENAVFQVGGWTGFTREHIEPVAIRDSDVEGAVASFDIDRREGDVGARIAQ